MKVIHTADWHLGQRLAGYDRSDEHRLFLDWLLKTIREQDVQVLVVAGDVFDSAHPPQASMQLYYDFLRDLSSLERCGAVFIGGNHDSPAHLNAPSGLLKRFQIHVIGSPSEKREEDVLQLTPGVDLLDSLCVCAVPYLRDRDVLRVVIGEVPGQRQERLREGIYHYYQDIRERAQAARDRGLPLLATGHLTLQPGSADPSGDEPQVGTLGALDDSRFPKDFDYVALGHLHAPHAVGDHPNIRYAGSPFPMSFSECDHEKSVVLLDFKEGRLHTCDTLPIPTFRRLFRFGGTLSDLEKWLQQLAPSQPGALRPWLEVHVTDDGVPHLPEKVTEILADKPYEVLKVMSQREETGSKIWQTAEVSLQEYTPGEVFAECCKAAGIDDLDEAAETFAELLALHEARKLELAD